MVTFDSFTTTISATSLTLCVTRDDCREQVAHHPRAMYKKLKTLDEAERWMKGDDASGTAHTTTSEDVVYTDGACSRNGQVGSVAGIGVWWGPSDPRCVFSRS